MLFQPSVRAPCFHHAENPRPPRFAQRTRLPEKSLSAVNDSMWLLGKSQMLLAHRAKTALAEHAEIARAIQKRDPHVAEEAARKHVRAAQRERLKLLFPDTAS